MHRDRVVFLLLTSLVVGLGCKYLLVFTSYLLTIFCLAALSAILMPGFGPTRFLAHSDKGSEYGEKRLKQFIGAALLGFTVGAFSLT